MQFASVQAGTQAGLAFRCGLVNVCIIPQSLPPEVINFSMHKYRLDVRLPRLKSIHHRLVSRLEFISSFLLRYSSQTQVQSSAWPPQS